MAYTSKTVTLLGTGIPVNLETGIAGALTAEQYARSIPCRGVKLQADGANANPLFIGSNPATLTTTEYGERIAAAAGGNAPTPSDYSSSEVSTKLADFWVIGTNAEKIHVGIIPY